ncbi:hypothetical protein M885DRAFT_478118 [Pelagophyceae sp. CCMP2097]|nr:hypothetical protein M885DRAFT_478118 [Pelagophyceae sp. CCMP2097]
MSDVAVNRLLYALLAVVLFLFQGECRRAWSARQRGVWDDRYISAVRAGPEEWLLGWRLEDLESRLHMQRFWASPLALAVQPPSSSSRAPPPESTAKEDTVAALMRVVRDDTAFVTLQCASRKSRLVHVGPDAFRDMADRCHVFSALEEKDVGPHAIWEIVQLDEDDGAVALRSFSNGKFARVQAPPANAAWNAPWVLETVSPLPGLAERFQLKKAAPPTAVKADDWASRTAVLDDTSRPAVLDDMRAQEAPESRNDAPARDDAKLDDAFFSRGRAGVEAAQDAEARGDDDWVRAASGASRRRLLRLGGDVFSGNPPLESLLGATPPGAAQPASRPKHQSVMLYSELMRGYLHCGGGGVSEPVRGFGGEATLDENPDVVFNVTTIDAATLKRARALLAASRHVFATTRGASSGAKAAERPDGKPSKKKAQARALTIAVVVPMTSRGTEMDSVAQSPLWFNLFASFVESVDWRTNRHRFIFYLGFDKADALYDTGDAWSEMRSSFKSHATKALTWLGYGNWTIKRVVQYDQRFKAPGLDLRLQHFEDTSGAPSYVVSHLSKKAVADGADYIYQLNDDTVLVSKDWVETYVSALQNSPLAPNLGVAGPLDTTNERILTHAFVHKTHVEIFHGMFPTAFRNWWSDDWISAVYGSTATFARRDVVVTHNVQSQKTGAWNRYDVDHSAQQSLHNELQRGFVTLNAWLRDRSYRTMPLPDVCGYSPMMTKIYDKLVRHGL